MNYSELKKFDISNGIGVRTSLFVSGCRTKCVGCFNMQAQDFNYGKEFTDDVIDEIIESLNSVNIEGLSILGGEPLEPENQKDILKLIKKVKQYFPQKDIWMWTGFTWEKLMNADCRANTEMLDEILENIDILVDGPFDNNKKNLLLRFRGSNNQRIIDIPKTLLCDQVVIWHDDDIFERHEW